MACTTTDLHVLAGLLLWCAIYFDETATEDADDITCVINRHSWLHPDNLVVSWRLPVDVQTTAVREQLHAEVTWDNGNWGNCSETTLTSCICKYGEPNVMDFSTEFTISVDITNNVENTTLFQKEWMIDPLNYRKPPLINSVMASNTSSTCLEVMWQYNTSSSCSTFPLKLYQIVYRNMDLPLEWKIAMTSKEIPSCNGSYTICNLQPYTEYEVGVQCKENNYMGTGQWNQAKTVKITTLEDVPAGAPELIPGAFSYAVDSCTQRGVRTITVFWKDVKSSLRNGIISSIILRVFKMTDNKDIFIEQIIKNGNTISCNVKLACDFTYHIEVKAATSAGPSRESSRITIPKHIEDYQTALVDVIPERDKQTKNTMLISWITKKTPLSNTTNFIIFSLTCVDISNGECKYSLNWTTVSNTSTEVNISSPGPYHDLDRFGVASGGRGITWSKCQYLKSTDVPIPHGLGFMDGRAERCLFLTWDNKPCESKPPEPYIHHFVIHVCKVGENNDATCLGNEDTYIADGKTSLLPMCDLDLDARYQVYMVAIGRQNTSSLPSTAIYGVPFLRKTFWSNPATKPMVALAIVFVLVGATVTILRVKKVCTRRYTIQDLVELENIIDNSSLQRSIRT